MKAGNTQPGPTKDANEQQVQAIKVTSSNTAVCSMHLILLNTLQVFVQHRGQPFQRYWNYLKMVSLWATAFQDFADPGHCCFILHSILYCKDDHINSMTSTIQLSLKSSQIALVRWCTALLGRGCPDAYWNVLISCMSLSCCPLPCLFSERSYAPSSSFWHLIVDPNIRKPKISIQRATKRVRSCN